MQPEYPSAKNQKQIFKPSGGCEAISHSNSRRSSYCQPWPNGVSTSKKNNHFAKACRQTPRESKNSLIAHVKYDDRSDRYTSINNEQITKIPAEVSASQPLALEIFPDSSVSLCLAGPNLWQSSNINPKTLSKLPQQYVNLNCLANVGCYPSHLKFMDTKYHSQYSNVTRYIKSTLAGKDV